METARDYGRYTPLVVVPARMAVEVPQFVHRVAAEVFVGEPSRLQHTVWSSITTNDEVFVVAAERAVARSTPVGDGRASAGRRRQLTDEDTVLSGQRRWWRRWGWPVQGTTTKAVQGTCSRSRSV